MKFYITIKHDPKARCYDVYMWSDERENAFTASYADGDYYDSASSALNAASEWAGGAYAALMAARQTVTLDYDLYQLRNEALKNTAQQTTAS